jgi:nucleoside-diphosphate-sugar epimerase
VHAAYTTRSRGRAHDARVNLEGSRRVLEAARRAGVERYVFVSSISAHEHAEGRYGQSKLVLERELDPARDLAIRPGLILARGAGLFDRMARVARGVGVVPMFGGGRQIIQTIHLDDLVQGFVLAITKGCTGTFTLCEPEGLPMRDLFGLMGRLSGRRIRVVPLPFGPALMALGACEWMGLRLPVSADNLRGLRSMRHQDSRASLERLGLGVRTAEESLRDLLGRGAGA